SWACSEANADAHAGVDVGPLLQVLRIWMAGPVYAWPDVDRTHAPGMAAGPVISSPWPTGTQWASPGLTAAVVWAGGMRSGRTKLGVMSWMVAKMTMVIAMAGTVRPVSAPVVAPRTKAKAA